MHEVCRDDAATIIYTTLYEKAKIVNQRKTVNETRKPILVACARFGRPRLSGFPKEKIPCCLLLERRVNPPEV